MTYHLHICTLDDCSLNVQTRARTQCSLYNAHNYVEEYCSEKSLQRLTTQYVLNISSTTLLDIIATLSAVIADGVQLEVMNSMKVFVRVLSAQVVGL